MALRGFRAAVSDYINPSPARSDQYETSAYNISSVKQADDEN